MLERGAEVRLLLNSETDGGNGLLWCDLDGERYGLARLLVVILLTMMIIPPGSLRCKVSGALFRSVGASWFGLTRVLPW